MGAAATQNRQIVAGQKYSSNDASSYNFSRETGFYVKSLIFKCQQLTPKKKKKKDAVPVNVFLGCIVQSNSSVVRERFVATLKMGVKTVAALPGVIKQLSSLNNAFVLKRQKGKLKYLSFAFFPLLL